MVLPKGEEPIVICRRASIERGKATPGTSPKVLFFAATFALSKFRLILG
jgi:hypothetical protein